MENRYLENKIVLKYCKDYYRIINEEFSELDRMHPDERPACPSCGDTLMLLPKSISKFYINEEGVYSRG